MGFTITREGEGLGTISAVVDRVLEEADAWGMKHIIYNTHSYCDDMVRFMVRKGFKVYEKQGILSVRSSGDSRFLEE